MPVVQAEFAEDLAVRILRGVGAPEPAARCVAESLVQANLTGHDSHGVRKLSRYVDDIRAGMLHPDAEPTVVRQLAGAAVIDGGSGFGHLAARAGADLVSDLATEAGLACVALRRCHHTGRIGNWSERIAARGLIAIIAGGEGHKAYYIVAPHGGAEGALATNPFSCAVPRSDGRPPVLLDYATSVVSIGKLQAAMDAGLPAPADSFIDADGNPSARLADFFDGGLLLPFGGYKGYALAVVAELLAVGLGGGDRVPETDAASALMMIAIQPDLLRPREEFDEFVDATEARLKAVAPRTPGGTVLLPGEPEQQARSRNADGVSIPDVTWAALHRLADEVAAGG
ncbi:Ldh family oxidoreductase [Amycolatopsis sp. A133]|uniref:Ldh family oxidoreductase n=1 Tax=Amycolatopsis sp. A133 TaxID=3064472 RepID=UPI0027E6AE6B|nr:Ldh family oxidoreductase [Amycolatopsis sp. A133]MDQ7803478.1 Ldh family oxidoreductase [Amycolatopsis sp. A133]